MAEFPFISLSTDEYLSDTMHLTTLEIGAYTLLLIVAWRAGGELPDSDKLLSRYTKTRSDQWKKIKPVLEPFFIVENGVWKHPELLKKLEAVRRKKKSCAQSANAKWLKNKETGNAIASNSQSDRNANYNYNTKKKKNTKKDLDKYNSLFDEFWQTYPNKVGSKIEAMKGYIRAREKHKTSHEEIMKGLKLAKEQLWADTERKFIPYASTWLNQERWNDEVDLPEENPWTEEQIEIQRAGGIRWKILSGMPVNSEQRAFLEIFQHRNKIEVDWSTLEEYHKKHPAGGNVISIAETKKLTQKKN